MAQLMNEDYRAQSERYQKNHPQCTGQTRQGDGTGQQGGQWNAGWRQADRQDAFCPNQAHTQRATSSRAHRSSATSCWRVGFG